MYKFSNKSNNILCYFSTHLWIYYDIQFILIVYSSYTLLVIKKKCIRSLFGLADKVLVLVVITQSNKSNGSKACCTLNYSIP